MESRPWKKKQWLAALLVVVSVLGLGAVGGDPLLTRSSLNLLLDQWTAKPAAELKDIENRLNRLETLAAQGETFKDMKNHWASPYVRYIYRKGITSGFPDGTYRPDDPLTREQVMVLIAKAQGWDAPAVKAAPFKDVAADRWSAPWIAQAKAKGFTSGYPGGVFKPEAPVTRAELATMVANAFQLKQGAKPAAPKDTPGHWGRGAIETIVSLGIDGLNGMGQFRPDAPATRGEVSMYLARAMEPAMRLP